jgi:class 3 adenylate cyclase
MAVAGPGEILTSRTVRDLVVGSGIALDDHGLHPLKGVQGGWQLFTVTRP